MYPEKKIQLSRPDTRNRKREGGKGRNGGNAHKNLEWGGGTLKNKKRTVMQRIGTNGVCRETWVEKRKGAKRNKRTGGKNEREAPRVFRGKKKEIEPGEEQED